MQRHWTCSLTARMSIKNRTRSQRRTSPRPVSSSPNTSHHRRHPVLWHLPKPRNSHWCLRRKELEGLSQNKSRELSFASSPSPRHPSLCVSTESLSLSSTMKWLVASRPAAWSRVGTSCMSCNCWRMTRSARQEVSPHVTNLSASITWPPPTSFLWSERNC